MRPVADVAIDLGTATTQVVVRGEGIVVDDLTLAAADRRDGKVVAIGRAACQEVADNASRLDLVHPLHNGTLSDAHLAEGYLHRLLSPVGGGRLSKLKLLSTVPSSATRIERRVLRESARNAGASSVELITDTMAAALGADLPVHEPASTLVINVGAGVTEAALISLGAPVGTAAVRSGSAAVDLVIKNVLRREYGIVVDDLTAEQIKVASGAAPADGGELVEASGVTKLDGSVATAILEVSEFLGPIEEHRRSVAEVLRGTAVQAPPELAQDMIVRGAHLVGAAASANGLAEFLSKNFEVPVHVVPEGRLAPVLGAQKCLEAMESLEELFVSESA